jgi:NADH-quinone oxidoreductase subunit J
MPGLPVTFFILALVAVGAAVGMLTSRNAVYSVLFLVLNFITIAILYLILGAPFIALSQITVYAGSIMVLFLFVIMLLGVERLQPSGNLRWQPFLALPLGAILMVVLGVNFFDRVGSLIPVAQVSATYGAPNEIGELLFSGYVLPFEVTALILLVAVIGSIILAKPEKLSAGQTARRVNGSMPAPAGAPSSASKEMPAAEQEKVLK